MSNLLDRLHSLIAIADSFKADATPPAPPTETGTITWLEILDLLKAVWPDGAMQNRLHMDDMQYPICAIADLRRFIEWDKTDLLGYSTELLDCDDFAIALAGSFARYKQWSGFPTGRVNGNLYNGHAFTIAVAWPSLEDRTPTLYYIEPQTDWELSREMVEAMYLWLVVV